MQLFQSFSDWKSSQLVHLIAIEMYVELMQALYLYNQVPATQWQLCLGGAAVPGGRLKQ
jgi:hypothetical protein